MHSIFLSALIPRNDKSFIRPLGPYRIASHLRQHGYNVQVIDFVHLFTHEEILKLIEKFITPETKFIGMGIMIDARHPRVRTHYSYLGILCYKIKKAYPQLKLIVGGSVSFHWSKVHQNKKLFDYVVNGYGEDQTLALFDHHYKGTPLPPFEIVDGNMHLSEHLVRECKYKFNSTMHEWDRRDCIQEEESLPIELARGCIFKCSFCRYPHIGKRKEEYAKQLDLVREELIQNYQKFGTTTYYVTDDTFNADTEFMKDFTDMVKSLPFKLKYCAYVRADLLQAHPEQEDMFLENGLISAFFGVESFDKKTSELYSKPWSHKKGKEYLTYINNDKWKDKIHLSLGLIVGGPYETLEDYRNTDKWCIDNNIPSWLWHPLSVSVDMLYYKSELDKNYMAAGFSFKLLEGEVMWYHNNCDQQKAVEWSLELFNETKPYQTPSSWTLIEYETYGYKFENTGFWKIDQYRYENILRRMEEKFINYKRDLMAL
jgi:radical SAM superfamily enzyme YgiQ (UPF0313 family)